MAQILSSNDDVIVDFYATWCGPCKRLAPHFEKAAEQLPSIVFVTVDVDKFPDVSNEYGIMQVPTVNRFRGGEREVVTARSVVQLKNELGA